MTIQSQSRTLPTLRCTWCHGALQSDGKVEHFGADCLGAGEDQHLQARIGVGDQVAVIADLCPRSGHQVVYLHQPQDHRNRSRGDDVLAVETGFTLDEAEELAGALLAAVAALRVASPNA